MLKKLIAVSSLALMIPTTTIAGELTTGNYSISPSSNITQNLTVDKENVTVETKRSGLGQKFYIKELKDGKYRIDTYFSILQTALTAGDKVYAYAKTDSNNQKWEIVKNNDSSYSIINNGKAITVDKGNVILKKKDNSKEQKFKITSFTDNCTVIFYTTGFREYKIVKKGGTVTPPPNPTRKGYKFIGWDQPLTNITKNLKVYPIWKADTYTVTFKEGNNVIKTQTVEYGKAANAPANPTKSGYVFDGWDKTFNNITGNITVNAKWKINKYTVTFTDGSGKTLKTQTVEHGKAATAPSNPTKNGYTFIGWDKTFDNITGNLTVSAKWKINKYTVIFTDGLGKTLKTQTVEKGANATAPANPTRAGYTFNGWDKNFTNITANITVNAQWKANTYTVTFKDGNNVIKTQTVEYGKAATAPTNPTKIGYKFNGWDKAFNNITANTTVTAKWAINSYTVKFTDGSGKTLKTQTVEFGKTATAPSNPTKTGYEFIGWDKTFNNITSDTIVVAEWKGKTFTVEFNWYDGKTYKETYTYGKANQTFGMNVSAKTGLFGTWTRPGYDLLGWSKTKNATTIDYATYEKVPVSLMENLKLYPVFKIQKYSVQFRDGTNTLKTESVEYGKAATAPTVKAKTGYNFSWDKDFSKVTSALIVNAKWKVKTVIVTFYDNYSGKYVTESYTYGKANQTFGMNYKHTGDFSSWIRPGYQLTGWADTSTGAKKYNLFSGVSDTWINANAGDIKLYGVWKTANHTVTFTDGQGKTLKTETVPRYKGATAPANPKRAGYKFTGWDKAFDRITGNITVNAKWSPDITIEGPENKTYVTGSINLNAKIGNNAKLTYSSSDTSVATVSSSGIVTGKKSGTVIITATASTGQKLAKGISVYAVTEKAQGWYVFSNNGKSIDVPSNKDTTGLQLQMYTTNDNIAQKIYLKKESTNIFKLITANELALEDVSGKVVQNKQSTSNNQKWKLIYYGGNCILVNVGTGKFLQSTSGKLTTTPTWTGNEVISFSLTSTTDASFGNPPTGWVEIAPKSDPTTRIDVSNNAAQAGTNIITWTKNGNNAQKYYIKGIGGGKYKIATGSSFGKKYVEHYSGNSVKQCSESETLFQQWYITKKKDGSYEFKTVNNKERSLTAINGKIEMLADADTSNQRFTITTTSAPTGSAYYPISYDRKWDMFVRKHLLTTEQQVFDEAVKNLNTDNTALEIGKGKVTSKNMAERVVAALRNQYYYYYLTYTDGKKLGTNLYDCYTYNEKNKSIILNVKKARTTYQKTKAIENMIQNASKNIFKSGMTEREAVAAANKWMLDTFSYKIHHDLYYAVTHKEIECEGYARIFELLMDVAGIESKYVHGWVDGWDDTTHAWNYVKIEDKWYYIDVCWNDSTTKPKNRYYLSEKIWADHARIIKYYYNY